MRRASEEDVNFLSSTLGYDDLDFDMTLKGQVKGHAIITKCRTVMLKGSRFSNTRADVIVANVAGGCG